MAAVTTHPPDFEHAIHTANVWAKSVAEALGTDDRHLAHRALRAWLHTLRDRLTVDLAAHFAAQLPELWRGAYYDGWRPALAPITYGRDAYVTRFAHEAGVSTEEVPGVARAVATAVESHVSPGQLDAVRRQLPHDLRPFLGTA